MTVPIVVVRVIRGTRPRKELDILWPNDEGKITATTELVNHRGVLHGEDGKIYPVRRGDEHEKVCEQVIKEQGYSFSRR